MTHAARAIPSVRQPIALAVLALGACSALHAAEFKAGDWDLSVGGIVNAYYTTASCTGSQNFTTPVVALATKATGCGGADGVTTVGNGLLPNVLSIGGKTKQEGYDISATLMVGSAVATSSAIGQNSVVDVRQGFFTFGNADMGTVKLGRDYGIFGANAILTDMTLVGVGSPTNLTQNGRVSLGHIGAGYSYLGHYGQIAYTAPAMGAVTISGGLMSPVNNTLGASAATAKRSPQVQLQAAVKLDMGKVWIGGKQQKFEGTTDSFTMHGVELGTSMNFGAFGLLANVQSGKSLGVWSDADNPGQKQVNTLLQGTYQATAKAKLGLSYGISKMKKMDSTVDSNLKSNANTTVGLYYGLTKSVTLVTEVSNTQSKNFGGEKAKQKGLALGGILFF